MTSEVGQAVCIYLTFNIFHPLNHNYTDQEAKNKELSCFKLRATIQFGFQYLAIVAWEHICCFVTAW